MSDRPANSRVGRNTVLAAFASLALVAASVSPSAAASTTAKAAVTASQAASDATDFSAAKRRYYRRGPNAAALAIMGAATGLAIGAIAESRRRDYHEDRYYYDRGSGYYGGPAYYGGSNYYRGPNRPQGPRGGYCAGGGPSAICGNFDQ